MGDIEVLIELYYDLESRLLKSNLSTKFLESTAGQELFDTDGSGLTPDVPYVINALCKAENHLYD